MTGGSREFVVDQWWGLGDVRAQAMFGSWLTRAANLDAAAWSKQWT